MDRIGIKRLNVENDMTIFEGGRFLRETSNERTAESALIKISRNARVSSFPSPRYDLPACLPENFNLVNVDPSLIYHSSSHQLLPGQSVPPNSSETNQIYERFSPPRIYSRPNIVSFSSFVLFATLETLF